MVDVYELLHRPTIWQRLTQRIRIYLAAPQMFDAMRNAGPALNWADECVPEMMLYVPGIRADIDAVLAYVATGGGKR